MLQTLPRSIALSWPLAAGLTAMMVCAGACSSPTAPLSKLTSTPAGNSAGTGRLVVSGNAVLTAPGQTTQLSVTDSAGAPVTSGVTWQTTSLGVASVSPSGLVTANTPGNTSIEARTSNATGTLLMYVTVPGIASAAPKVLSSCQFITAGNYVLNADLPVPGSGACLSGAGTVSLQVDCQGHALPGLSLANVGAASFSNCALTRSSTLANVSGVTIAKSTFSAPLTVTNSSNVTISDSSFATSAFYVVQMISTTGTQLLRDTITDTAASASAAVLFQNGSNNQTVQCTITGTYNGASLYNGTDDGILDINEVGDTFQGNTIRNFFDTAVEGVDLVANWTVADNSFSNIGVASISSYWCTNWTGTVFRNNDVSNTPMLLYTDYATGLGQCGASSIAGGFSNNQIVGNHFHNPLPNALSEIRSVEAPNGGRTQVTGPIPRLIVAMRGLVTNNLVQGNDFGTSDGPFLSPLTGFSDGGGNICGPLNPKVSNFACTGAAPSALIRRR